MTSVAVVKSSGPSFVAPFRQRDHDKDKVTPAKLGIQTLISQGTTFVGDLESTGGMKLDGSVTGNVTIKSETDAWLVVAGTAVIDGDIAARVVAVCGRVKGMIKARHVTLMPGAQVDGDIYYEVLRIAEGAQVNGRLNKVTSGAAS